MKVERAAVMGFCMGVKRAVETALATASDARGRRVYTYGPLIHNPSVITQLERQGVAVLDPKQPLPSQPGAVILRAHGVAPAVRQMLAESGWEIIDATCPRVLASQKIAQAASERGHLVVVVGDRLHGEVQAIAGCADPVAVIQDAADLETLRPTAVCTVIAQTTIKKEEYEQIVGLLEKKFPQCEFQTHRTICPATRERQEALSALVEKCEAVVVIGGKNSANTVRLADTVRRSGKPVWQIEASADLVAPIAAYGTVGVTAGASTPETVIEEVIEALETMKPTENP